MKKQLYALAIIILLLATAMLQVNAQTNVALGKPVTAQGTTAGLPAYVVDGDTTTRWQSAASNSQWIYVDLGVKSNIQKVSILFNSASKGWAVNYYVQVSDDATNWTPADSLRSNTQADTHIDSIKGIGRYVRILLSGRATGGVYFIIKELKVYGYPNIALDKPVTVSSTKSSSYQGSYATDGNIDTKWWSTTATPNEWLYVDLGKAYNIKTVAIRWNTDSNNAYATGWDTQVSNDASTWTTVDTKSLNSATFNYIGNLTAKARYVRFYGISRANVNQGYSINEFEVYGYDANNVIACDGSSEVNRDSLYPPPGWYPPYMSPKAQPNYPAGINAFKAAPLACGDIVMIGNSITHGGDDWATRLCNPTVKNRGISGDLTDGIIARLGEIYFYKPSKVFIEIGVNNLQLKYDPSFPNGYTPQYIADSICNIVNKIHSKSPGTKIYVQSILPVTGQYGQYRPQIRYTNDSLKAREPHQNYTFIDVHSLLADSATDFLKTEYSKDGLHLTEPGYRVWVKKLVDNYDITPLSTGNLALNKPVITTSALNPSFPGSNAVDGDTATQWHSGAHARDTMRVDLGRTYSIQKIIIRWSPAAYGKAFTITTSDDELNWTTIRTVTNNTSGYEVLDTLSGLGRYVRMNGITTFGTNGYGIYEFEVYGPTTPPLAPQAMPESVLTFNAKADQNSQIDLAWQITSEINNDYFTIEKSHDGSKYSTLAKISSYGNGSHDYTYTYTDTHPFGGNNYYRLAQTAKDGTKTYRGVKLITLSLSSVSVFPNPVNNRKFTVYLKNCSYPVNLQLVNTSGHVVYIQKLVGITSSQSINITLPASIGPGVYILTTGSIVTKVLISN